MLKLLVLLLLTSLCLAAKSKILVLVQDEDVSQTHSQFLKDLEAKFLLEITTVTNDSVHLSVFGEWQYDSLVLFAPSQEWPAGVSVSNILQFIDAGHNVLLVGDSDLGRETRELASECGVEFEEEETFVVDHFHSEGDATRVLAGNILNNQVILGKEGHKTPILFKGIGQDIEEDSPLLFPIVWGYSTTYSANPTGTLSETPLAGTKTVLVSALQARNNARVIFSGSFDLFSDEFYNSKHGNKAFGKNIISWVFQGRGLLRASDEKHTVVGQTESPAVYRIKDDLAYSVKIEEWNGDSWTPATVDDVQLEFRMLDPYVRVTLKHDAKGVYSTQYKVPDVYGIFTFKIEYTRKGYGFLNTKTRVPVRPFRHNEYERFIDSAYPYYVSSLSMLVGLFIFSWVFLYNKSGK